ncbi:metal-dependent hydrolase family protein [Biformimicrobium ophioploci]|uniref:metal-dependent hydrolase family protein n=1 Tax=Biformimicrobium ophioploci TaxID=3036711 RepID=UPI002555E3E0|nr:amidohydrolase family protein [Microbulbifer sp. NKW57]
MGWIARLTVAALGVVASAAVFGESYAIHAGKLFDSEKATLLAEQTIHVVDGHIDSVEPGYQQREGASVIDLRGYTVLPGLMDMHTHLLSEHSARSYMDRFILNAPDYTLRGVVNAEKTLMAGFTTVRDLGDMYNATVSLRKAINAGAIDGPRVFTAAKSIATTGGHADPTNGFRADLMGNPVPGEGVVNGVAAAREAVRQRYKDGADLIKITATGGVLSMAKSGQNPQFMQDELEAIVQTAKDYGFSVAVHAHGKEGMKRAVNAGVDSIEHGTYMDAEVMSLMRRNGTWMVPTLMAGEWVTEKARVDGFFPDMVRVKAAEIGPLMQETFSEAYRRGVRIAFGTDSGVSAHGGNAREFVLMVDGGMPAAEALQAATLNAAQLLRVEDELGSIASGKHADIVAVKGNPLEDITLMQSVPFVMKAGIVYKQPQGETSASAGTLEDEGEEQGQ